MEDIEKNIEAIEKEKKEFLENGEIEEDSEEELEDEEVEVNEMEFSLTESEIDEWINELTRLKEEKSSIELFIDEENDLKINFEEEE
jgi:hypothetical protein